MTIPARRHSYANDAPVRADGDYVLYWMIANRRTHYNFALQHAVDQAKQFGKPLVIFEPLRVRYPWASDRMHRFVIEGMRDNREALAGKEVVYYPYVEPTPGVASPLLYTLAKRSCTVVTDEYPCFFLPDLIRAVKRRIPARLELVDSNGVMPLRSPDRTFTVAHSYRRWMQKNILDVLLEMPKKDPLARVKLPKSIGLPNSILKRWPAADLDSLLRSGGLDSIPMDHDVKPSETIVGGARDAGRRLASFLKNDLRRYNEDRNHPNESATTGLSPHLHFGHISAHEMVQRVLDHEDWTPDMASPANGKNHGFWNTTEPAEAFLDQVLTWREMGFNRTFRENDRYDQFDSLPDWALATLRKHAADPRPEQYDLEQLEHANTADPIWNAAQREIVRTGVMHNYMRMLWGKKILQWTRSPEQALSVMIELNNKYGLDGRDPNSYNGIFWVLGRFDRAWGPERPIFGSVRYMTSDSAKRKLRMDQYLLRFGPMQQDHPIEPPTIRRRDG
ncbi:cryptochrome/DNA photolyase family protein [Novipirellula artificiosorum]|uniref:Deoxyribodipyrimidine photo-lyase n=1 Tax=Novipirellula artificiosorum TaxID=2528016 RepID=A0A5C6DN24_9BACT|nr:deoxyribodipyrimidine photolyase [Novipirellula artificiosorum]TWU37257.1 deoxyribodipyrimidine photolyase [Novipirellula artificiosorum]